jgi:hypothetical protein
VWDSLILSAFSVYLFDIEAQKQYAPFTAYFFTAAEKKAVKALIAFYLPVNRFTFV